MSAYSSQTREQIAASLRSVGFDSHRAQIAVDLACHAAEKAHAAFATVVSSAPDLGIGMALTEIGAQLAREHFQRIFDFTHKVAEESGIPSCQVEVAV